METNTQIVVTNSYLPMEISNESIQERVFKVSKLAVLIFNDIPWAELARCRRVNKTFHSILNYNFSLHIFLEWVKSRIDSIVFISISDKAISRIAQIQTCLSIKEAKITLEKLTEKKYAIPILIEIVKKALESNQLEMAVQAANEICDPIYKFKAWLMILDHRKTAKNLENCEKAITEIISREDSALAYLQLWNIVKDEFYFITATALIEEVSEFEKFKFWFEFSKMDPTSENKQKAKNQITLFLDNLDVLTEKILEHFNAAIDFAKAHEDKTFMEEIKTKIETIETPSTKLEIWRRICQREPDVEKNFEEAIHLINHATDGMSYAEICFQFFELTKKHEYLDRVSNLIDHALSQVWGPSSKIDSIKSVLLKLIKAKSDHNQIAEAKGYANKIEYDIYLQALAWIAIWKNEKTEENLQKALFFINSNSECLQADLWVELAEACAIDSLSLKPDWFDNQNSKFNRVHNPSFLGDAIFAPVASSLGLKPVL